MRAQVLPARQAPQMAKVISCGVLMLNVQRERFVCHTTGTSRWDVPKGVQVPGESALQAAVRETWEETQVRGRDSRRYESQWRYLVPGLRLRYGLRG